MRQRKTGSTRFRSTITSGDRVPAAGHNSLSAWLLLVLYPFALPLGTVPVMMGDTQVSAEFLFAILCVLVVAMQAGMGSLKVRWGNQYFLLGLAIWLSANVLSLL